MASGGSGLPFDALNRDVANPHAQEELPVRVTPATDPGSVAAVSQAILSKYATSPYARVMVSDDIVPTTLRLDPRR